MINSECHARKQKFSIKIFYTSSKKIACQAYYDGGRSLKIRNGGGKFYLRGPKLIIYKLKIYV